MSVVVQVTVSEPLAKAPSSSGTIVLVVAEGLEVLLPMAGGFCAAAQFCFPTLFCRLLGADTCANIHFYTREHHIP